MADLLDTTPLGRVDLPQVILEEVSLPRTELKSLQYLQAGIDPTENARQEIDRRVTNEIQTDVDDVQLDPVDMVYNNLGAKEGVGDIVTDIPTGALGVTGMARSAVGAKDDVPDDVVAKQYLDLLNNQWNMRNGYTESPTEIKAMLLDASYNMGEQTMNFPELSAALQEGNYEQVALELLDTANVEGMAVKGVAKRRAQSYNLYAKPENEIHSVEQLKDGTIIYRGKGGEELYSYRAEGGRHPKSKAGRIDL